MERTIVNETVDNIELEVVAVMHVLCKDAVATLVLLGTLVFYVRRRAN